MKLFVTGVAALSLSVALIGCGGGAKPEPKKTPDTPATPSMTADPAAAQTETKTEEAAPAKTEEAAPAKTEEAAPAKTEEAAPAKTEEAAPAKTEEKKE